LLRNQVAAVRQAAGAKRPLVYRGTSSPRVRTKSQMPAAETAEITNEKALFEPVAIRKK
jgi:hypothetical protein